MTEITTIKVRKPMVEWLNSLKGYLEYRLSRKMTLDDALFSILGEIEIFFAEKQGIISRANIKECEDFVNNKISIFWDDDENKPIFYYRTSGEWLNKRLEKKKNTSRSVIK
jgi:hypothetical protein